MSERPKEAKDIINFIHRTRHLPITGMELPDACGEVLDYITQLEAQLAEAKVENVKLHLEVLRLGQRIAESGARVPEWRTGGTKP